MYLLDTDIVSNFRRSRPHPNLVAWLKDTDSRMLAVSAMTIFEIQAGAELVRAGDPRKAEEIESWLDGFVLAGQFSILPVGTDVARTYAAMFARPSLKSFLIPDPRSRHPKSGADLVLAATAIVHGATVVTADKGDFLRIHREFPLPALYEPFGKTWEIGAP